MLQTYTISFEGLLYNNTYTAINIDNFSWKTWWPWQSCRPYCTTSITLKTNVLLQIYCLGPPNRCSVELARILLLLKAEGTSDRDPHVI